MTEPFRPDDELVSSVIDGEATADERARVDADPTLTARLAEFRRVRALVGEAVAPRPEADRDAVIARAVAERNRSDPVVTALRPRRDARAFLAVAAGLLFVLLAAGFVVSQLGQDEGADSSDVAASDDSGGSSSEAADETGFAETQSTAGAEAAADSDRVALGEVADEAALRETLQAQAALPTENSEGGDGGATPRTTVTAANLDQQLSSFADEPVRGASTECGVRLAEADPSLTGFLIRGTAVYRRTPAVVYVFPGEAGDQRVVVVSAEGCELLDSFLL